MKAQSSNSVSFLFCVTCRFRGSTPPSFCSRTAAFAARRRASARCASEVTSASELLLFSTSSAPTTARLQRRWQAFCQKRFCQKRTAYQDRVATATRETLQIIYKEMSVFLSPVDDAHNLLSDRGFGDTPGCNRRLEGDAKVVRPSGWPRHRDIQAVVRSVDGRASALRTTYLFVSM